MMVTVGEGKVSYHREYHGGKILGQRQTSMAYCRQKNNAKKKKKKKKRLL
jgi:hypothetical protein